MDRSQAEAVVALVQAYFPRPELPASTVMAWAAELELHDFADAQEAARRLARGRTYPVLAEMLEYVEEVRRERVLEDERPALLAAEFAEQMPPEVRERVDQMHERWADEPERDHRAQEAEWQQVKTATLARLRMHGVCLGAGKEPVELDGQLVCPVCRVETGKVARA